MIINSIRMTTFRSRPLADQERSLCEQYRWLALARATAFQHRYGLRGGLEWSDLAQMAFLGLALAAKGFRPGEASFATYARVVIDRELTRLSLARAYTGHPRALSLDEPISEEDGPTWEEILPDRGAIDPCDEACRSALHREVREALATLDERPRRIVESYYLKQLTLKEIAAQEGISPQRVHQVIQTASRRLRAALESYQIAA